MGRRVWVTYSRRRTRTGRLTVCSSSHPWPNRANWAPFSDGVRAFLGRPLRLSTWLDVGVAEQKSMQHATVSASVRISALLLGSPRLQLHLAAPATTKLYDILKFNFIETL